MRKQFVVKRGQTVVVELPVRASITGARKGFENHSVIKLDDEDDLYVFRKKGVRIFDIATFLLDGDYHDYNFKDGTLEYNQAKLDNFFALTTAKYLEAPFSNTKLDGKFRRKPLEFASEHLWVDVAQTNDGDVIKRTVIGEDNVRPLLVDSFSTDPNTARNAPNASNRGWIRDRSHTFGGGVFSGILKSVANLKGIAVESYGYFLDFNTLDTTRFKITKLPSIDAPEVVPALKTLNGIYLVPYVCGIALTFKDTVTYPIFQRLIYGGLFKRLFDASDPPTTLSDPRLVTANNGASFPNISLFTALTIAATWYHQAPSEPNILPWEIYNVKLDSVQWRNSSHITFMYDWTDKLRGVLTTGSQTYYIWFRLPSPQSSDPGKSYQLFPNVRGSAPATIVQSPTLS